MRMRRQLELIQTMTLFIGYSAGSESGGIKPIVEVTEYIPRRHGVQCLLIERLASALVAVGERAG